MLCLIERLIFGILTDEKRLDTRRFENFPTAAMRLQIDALPWPFMQDFHFRRGSQLF